MAPPRDRPDGCLVWLGRLSVCPVCLIFLLLVIVGAHWLLS